MTLVGAKHLQSYGIDTIDSGKCFAPTSLIALIARGSSSDSSAAASHKFLGHPDELWHQMLAVNLTSAYYVTKALAPQMVARGAGRIIMIAPVASKLGARYIAAY